MLNFITVLAASVLLSASDFTREADGVYSCDVSRLPLAAEIKDGYCSGGWANAPRYPELYFGEEPMTLAREPNSGWRIFVGENNVRVGDLPKDGYSLAGYWTQDWAFEALRVASVTNGVPVFRDRHQWGIGAKSWGAKERRYYAVNHRRFLDAPGEWYLTKDRLYLIPPRGDIASEPIRLAWGDTAARVVAHLTNAVIRGETIAFGGGAGLVLRDCHHLLVTDCTVECVNGNGIDIGADCSDVVISNCVIRDVGGCGVVLNGGDRRHLANGDNRVVDCEITRFARRQRVYAPGVLLNGCGNAIVRCRIHDAPHSAIIYGGNEHLIAENDIHGVILETGDAGAIYTGRDWTSQGNRVVGNHIHDLGRSVAKGNGHDVFTMGVYLDDCDSGDTVASNLFERAGCAVMMGGGRDNVVRGNRLIDCDIGIHLDARGVTWTDHWNNPGDASWNLIGKAEKLHYREDPWCRRYPHLAKIMGDEPRLPKYNRFEDNALVRCRLPYQFDTDAAVWAHARERFFSEKTGLFYGCDGRDYEDCAILNGQALSLCVDLYDGKRADEIARGLLALGKAHGVPGYVMRGIARDGKTWNRNSSRDQVTHYVHGLFRYYLSGLADAPMKREIATALAAVADRMLANVTAANDWNALDMDGKVDTRGVLKMWNVQAHEAARLPCVYLAAWKATGAEKYRVAYERCVEAALDQSWGVTRMDPAERRDKMPGYAFLQMNASLEVIRLGDATRANRAEAVMKEVARLAAERFVAEKGSDGPWLSAAGDLAVAVAMIAKVESIEKVLGARLYGAARRLLDDCLYGLNGQSALYETHSDRFLSFLDVRARLK